MWISNQSRQAGTAQRGGADLGVVTVGGQEPCVYLGTERRWVPVMSPGGYRWRPGVGERVLVLKTGQEGEGACILARQEQGEGELLPGEVELRGGACALKLTQAGSVELSGSLLINGVALQTLIQNAVIAALPKEE